MYSKNPKANCLNAVALKLRKGKAISWQLRCFVFSTFQIADISDYDVAVSADKVCTHGKREFYGFARSFDTVFTQ